MLKSLIILIFCSAIPIAVGATFAQVMPEADSSALGGRTIVINGALQEDIKRKPFEYNLYQESLIIRNGRVYIYTTATGMSRQYYVLHYLLPETVKYDSQTKEIVYIIKDGKRLIIGKSKKFLNIIPYIALRKEVKILSSPYDAKLVIAPEQEVLNSEFGVRSSDHGDMDSILKEKCSQCHVINYILAHKEWTEDDCLHVFSRLQAKKTIQLTEKEVRMIEKFKAFQRGAVSAEEVRKFDKLREMGRSDVRSIAEIVYQNNCAPCHSPSKMETITQRYPKRRCATIVQRMQEKDPTLFLEANTDALTEYLWQLKIRPTPDER
ncbi:MAG TPA: hypothetical protein ACFYD6_06580 [Candidatus Brocadiia bacterium]|nr:hypothetical protein [Candidatus Brocadiales bacterium]